MSSSFSGGDKGADFPGVDQRQAHQELLLAALQLNKEPVSGIARVEQHQAVVRGMLQMHAGTTALIHIRRDQKGVQGMIRQQILQDRNPGHRQSVVGAEVPGQCVFQGQVHAGTVHGQQAQTLPGCVQPQFGHLVLQGVIQGFKGRGTELPAGLAEGLGGDHAGFKGRAIEGLKEHVQFGLQGAVGLVQQKQDEITKGQVTAAGKVLWLAAVFRDEIGTIQKAGYFMYKLQSGSRWACQPLVVIHWLAQGFQHTYRIASRLLVMTRSG